LETARVWLFSTSFYTLKADRDILQQAPGVYISSGELLQRSDG